MENTVMSEKCSGACSSCASSCKDAEKKSRLDSIKHKILILSGKGGVGKSTVAASVAVSLARMGKKVALLDLDFHGPTQPTLFNLQTVRLDGDENGIIPAEVAGVKIVSLGLLLDNQDAAVIWRGPAKISVIKQLFEEVNYGDDLDFLIMDFPPGTGDEVLSAAQMTPGDKKAIIVTTPQEVSLSDCRKCVDFCSQLKVPILGIVENMSSFICPDCSHSHTIFGKGGGRRLAEKAATELISEIPLDPVFLSECDAGLLPDGLDKSKPVADAVNKIAQRLVDSSSN